MFDVVALQDDIQGLTIEMTKTFGQVDAAFVGLKMGKMDKTNEIIVSIPTSG